jgi:demethylmenaquinone methyltransferase/2-methoxy-6-polyprenyl-1,4-benzoquinol methylase
MFDAVAPGYDRTNTLMSLGFERGWRRAVTEALELTPGHLVLDLAAGTGTSAVGFARCGARVVAVDFSLGMLRAARARGRHGEVLLVAADGLRLPFCDQAFDRVTVSFGLRNVADVTACLRELLRVTRAGGRLVVCEVSRPTWPPFRWLYRLHLRTLLPLAARAAGSNRAAYGYLVESIRAWPDQVALAGVIRAAGWTDAGWRNLTGGIVAVHRAVAPPGRPAPTGPGPAGRLHSGPTAS